MSQKQLTAEEIKSQTIQMKYQVISNAMIDDDVI